MYKQIRLQFGALLLLASFVGHASAQRQGVPVVDFKDIPVSLATSKAVTPDQVRQAILTGALAEKWESAPESDGSIRLSYFKNGKHTVVLKVEYTAEKYSVTFQSAENMNYFTTGGQGTSAGLIEAKRKQRSLLEGRPEYRFSAPRPDTLIHPFYEGWVHNMLSSVRRQLQASQ